MKEPTYFSTSKQQHIPIASMASAHIRNAIAKERRKDEPDEAMISALLDEMARREVKDDDEQPDTLKHSLSTEDEGDPFQ